MKQKLSMEDLCRELRNLHSDLNSEQCKLYTRSMALKTIMHEVKELADTVKSRLEKEKEEIVLQGVDGLCPIPEPDEEKKD